MKKQKNATRVIAIVLVLLMALALVPIAASAQSDVPITWTYQGNGGSYDTVEDEQTITHTSFVQTSTAYDGADETGGITVAANPFTYAHHTFTGWKRTSPAEDYWQPDDFAPSTSDSTLEAEWEQILVSVSFGSGSHGNCTIDNTAYADLDAGSSITLPAWSGDIDDHWSFAGWKYGTNTYQPSTSFELPDEDVTFVAQWVGEEVTVSYASGGATGGSEPTNPLAGTYSYGGGFVLPECSWTKTGHAFTGWTVGTATQQPGEDLDWTQASGSPASITITATWAQTVTISYNTDGGLPVPEADVIPKGGTLQTLPEVSKEGFDFQGWYDGSELVTAPYSTTTNKQLKAHWLSTTIPVTFDGNGGGGSKDAAKAPRTGSYTVPDSTGFTPPPGTQFAYWTIEADGVADSGKYTAGSTYTVTEGTEELELIANWENTTVVVTLDKNGGTGTNQTQSMSRVSSIALTTLSELGYTAPSGSVFLGWNTNPNPDPKAVEFTDGESVVWDKSDAAHTPDEPTDPATNPATKTLYAIWEPKISGSVTIGRGETHNITDPKVNDSLKAYPDITPESSSLHYRWLLDGEPIEGATTDAYTVPATAYMKEISVEVSNDPSFSYSVKSPAYLVGANAQDKCEMTVVFVGEPAGFTVKVNNAPVVPAGSPYAVVKGGTATVALVAGTSTKYVSKLQLGTTTREGTAVMTSNDMPVPNADTCTLTVTFEDNTPGQTKTATIDPSANVNAARNAITTAVKDTLPAGQKDRVWVSAYAVIPCWDNNILKPLKLGVEPTGEIPATGLGFKLGYPTDAGYNDLVRNNMTTYCNITVYHYKDATLAEVKTAGTVTVTKNPKIGDGVQIAGYTNFSDFGVGVSPKDLDKDFNGKVNVTGLTDGKASVGSPLTAEFKSTVATPAGTLSYQWEYLDGSAWKPISGATSATYVPKVPNQTLHCKVTSSFETGSVSSVNIPVTGLPKPVKDLDIINGGDIQFGQIKNVTSDMLYQLPGESGWNVITGDKIAGLTVPGTYYVCFKDSEGKPITSTKVPVPEPIKSYYTVTCYPDSVSANRLSFSAAGDYAWPYKSNVWLVENGKTINVTASSTDTRYYKITGITRQMVEYPYTKTSKTFSNANSGSTGSFTVSNTPYVVWASAGVYGSKTGDTSHLGLWMELACLSLMGLCAAAVFGRKKFKKQ